MNVCEYTVEMAQYDHQRRIRKKGMVKGMEGKEKGSHPRLLTRLCLKEKNDLIGNFICLQCICNEGICTVDSNEWGS